MLAGASPTLLFGQRRGKKPPAPAPIVVGVTASPALGEAPLAVSFAATAIYGTPPYRYTWTFSDNPAGIVVGAASIEHTFAADGVYAATVRVTDRAKQSATATAMVYVMPRPAAPGPNFTLIVTA